MQRYDGQLENRRRGLLKAYYVNSFNTQIPANQFTVIVVGSHFICGANEMKGLKLTYSGTDYGTFAAGNVYADRKIRPNEPDQQTWYLHADYAGAHPADNASGTWDIFCLIINNSMVNTLPSQEYNLNGSSIGTGNMPSGL